MTDGAIGTETIVIWNRLLGVYTVTLDAIRRNRFVAGLVTGKTRETCVSKGEWEVLCVDELRGLPGRLGVAGGAILGEGSSDMVRVGVLKVLLMTSGALSRRVLVA